MKAFVCRLRGRTPLRSSSTPPHDEKEYWHRPPPVVPSRGRNCVKGAAAQAADWRRSDMTVAVGGVAERSVAWRFKLGVAIFALIPLALLLIPLAVAMDVPAPT